MPYTPLRFGTPPLDKPPDDYNGPVTFRDKVTFIGPDSSVIIEGGVLTGDIELSGDFASGNWDGADPANLAATYDNTATAGYYFDYSAGSAQIMGNLFFPSSTKGVVFPFSNDKYMINVVGDTWKFIYEYNDGAGAVTLMDWDESSNDWNLRDTAAAGLFFWDKSASLMYMYQSTAIQNNLLVYNGGGFEVRDNTGNPYFRVAIDSATSYHNSVINAWGNSSAAPFTVGSTQSGAQNFKVIGRATVSGGQWTGAYSIDLMSVADSLSGGVVRINGGGNVGPSSAGAGQGILSISNATTGRSVFDHQLLFGVTTVANVGWIQMVDPGVAYYTLALNPNGGQVALGPGPYNLTTGSAANMHLSSGALGYNIYRFTSARKYKRRINYNVDYLADIELRPTKHYRPDDKRWFYNFIADDLGDQDKLLGVYDDGEIESYDQFAVMAVMAAKINRLERHLTNCPKCGRLPSDKEDPNAG